MGRTTQSMMIALAALIVAGALAAGCGDGSPPEPGTPAVRVTATRTAVAQPSPTCASADCAATPTAPPAATKTPRPLPPTATAVPPTQGARIEGIVLVGPQCPVVREGEQCPDKPLEATITAVNVSGASVASTRSGADGRFALELSPGRYTLVPEDFGTLPHGSELEVDLAPGETEQVVVSYDSGIR